MNKGGKSTKLERPDAFLAGTKVIGYCVCDVTLAGRPGGGYRLLESVGSNEHGACALKCRNAAFLLAYVELLDKQGCFF